MRNRESITSLDRIRNLGIFAHIDAGKTTLTERILYYTGKTHRMGDVDTGDTQMDWMEQERARGITITSAVTTCFWRERRLNLIDTPGHIDFTAEVERSLRVLDGAVIVICAAGGVEPQTESVWRHADRYQLPRILFINKMDRDIANFDQAVASIRERLGARPLLLQWPVGEGLEFRGVIDLLEEQLLTWDSDPEGQQTHRAPIPAELNPAVQQARGTLVEELATVDDSLLVRALEEQPISASHLRAALRRATLASAAVPVLCGSALDRIGVQPVLDAIVDFLPSPLDRPPVQGVATEDRRGGGGKGKEGERGDGSGAERGGDIGEGEDGRAEKQRGRTVEQQEDGGTLGTLATRQPHPDEPFSGLIFKVISDEHTGRLVFVRAYSGTLQTGDHVLNPRTGETERVGRVLHIHANRRENTNSLRVGEVAALVGIKLAATGDTLCAPEAPVALAPISFPEPVIAVAVESIREEDRERLVRAVHSLSAEDPTVRATFDEETRDYLLSGMGELHLEILVDRLQREFGVEVSASDPRVAYRETIRRPARGQSRYKRQTGGHGHFADVRLRVEPLSRGEGFLFRNRAPRAEIPASYIPALRAGIYEALQKGILAGYPVTDVRVTVLGGRSHAVDSSARDFHIAGSQAFKRALRNANPLLLEPIMDLIIVTPEEYLGTVMVDLGQKRGTITEMEMHGPVRHLRAEVPLANLLQYATHLRGQTQGRGTFAMEFRAYREVPPRLQSELLAAWEAERRETTEDRIGKRRRRRMKYMRR